LALVDTAWRAKAVRKKLRIACESARPPSTHPAVGSDHMNDLYGLYGVRDYLRPLHHTPGRLLIEDVMPFQGDVVGVCGHGGRFEYRKWEEELGIETDNERTAGYMGWCKR
jgi:hypothetical protein